MTSQVATEMTMLPRYIRHLPIGISDFYHLSSSPFTTYITIYILIHLLCTPGILRNPSRDQVFLTARPYHDGYLNLPNAPASTSHWPCKVPMMANWWSIPFRSQTVTLYYVRSALSCCNWPLPLKIRWDIRSNSLTMSPPRKK